MPEPVALKQLTASDLTFFAAQFRRLNVGNQKSINLNADPFSSTLYPALAGAGLGTDMEIPVSVAILGPKTADHPYKVTRSITKKAAYKNWRLNGAAVSDPPDEPGRFDVLVPGDIALMEFVGDHQPSGITIIIVSRSIDPELHRSLASVIPGGRQSMVVVPRAKLASIVDSAMAPRNHPVWLVLRDPELEAALEDAAFGSDSAVAKLRKRGGPKVTAADLAAARANAEIVGADGEALVWSHLCALKYAGQLADAKWTSKSDAAAPWDFEVKFPDGEETRVEVKSTSGPFGRTIHMSAAELLTAAEGGVRYDVWRMFDIDKNGGRLRVAEDIASFAKSVLAGVNLPAGVRVDVFSIDPACLKGWTSPETIVRPGEPE